MATDGGLQFHQEYQQWEQEQNADIRKVVEKAAPVLTPDELSLLEWATGIKHAPRSARVG